MTTDTMPVTMKIGVHGLPTRIFRSDEALVAKQITFLRYPAGIGLGFEFGEPRYSNWDLSSSEKEVFPIVQSHHVEHWIPKRAAVTPAG